MWCVVVVVLSGGFLSFLPVWFVYDQQQTVPPIHHGTKCIRKQQTNYVQTNLVGQVTGTGSIFKDYVPIGMSNITSESTSNKQQPCNKTSCNGEKHYTYMKLD